MAISTGIRAAFRIGKKIKWYTPTPMKIAVAAGAAAASVTAYVGYKVGKAVGQDLQPETTRPSTQVEQAPFSDHQTEPEISDVRARRAQ